MKRVLTVCLALHTSLAQAEFFTGNKLLGYMRGSDVEEMFAAGYVIGVADAIRGVLYCPPDSVTVGQLGDMVKQYLLGNPSQRHQTADTVVVHVLRTTWPCAPKPTTTPGRTL